MSLKKSIMIACLLVTLFGQAFAATVSGEIKLNSAGTKPTVSGEVNTGLNSAEDYVPLYESNTDETPLYSAPAYDTRNDYMTAQATNVKTGPEQVLFLIVALLLAILIYKKYHPFAQK